MQGKNNVKIITLYSFFWKIVNIKLSHYRPSEFLEGGKVVSPTHRPPLIPQDTPGTHFCYRQRRPQWHSVAGRIMSMKDSNDSIGNRIHDRTACSAVPQRTAPLCRSTTIMDPILTFGMRVSVLYVYCVSYKVRLSVGWRFLHTSVKVNALWGSKQLKLRKSKSRFYQPSHQSERGTAHCLTLQHSVLSCSVRT
jgi:hypothetical protein